jgi:hypothetical protein
VEVAVDQEAVAGLRHAEAVEGVVETEEEPAFDRSDLLDDTTPDGEVGVPTDHVDGEVSHELVVGEPHGLTSLPVPPAPDRPDPTEAIVIGVAGHQRPQPLDGVGGAGGVVVVDRMGPVVAVLRHPALTEGHPPGGAEVLTGPLVDDPAFSQRSDDLLGAGVGAVVDHQHDVGQDGLGEHDLKRVGQYRRPVVGDDERGPTLWSRRTGRRGGGCVRQGRTGGRWSRSSRHLGRS